MTVVIIHALKCHVATCLIQNQEAILPQDYKNTINCIFECAFKPYTNFHAKCILVAIFYNRKTFVLVIQIDEIRKYDILNYQYK